jgi:hypothetical protein
MVQLVKAPMSWIFGWSGTLATALIFAAYLTLTYWPASWWYSVRSVVVLDSVVGADVLMRVDRAIHRPFVGQWSVLVRRLNADGAWEIVCDAQGRSNYRPDAALPSPLTLEWWTAGQCSNPPAGKLLISTIWTIEPAIGNTKAVVVESNIFEVTEP